MLEPSGHPREGFMAASSPAIRSSRLATIASNCGMVDLTIQDKGCRLRTEAKGTNGAVFRARGVALPPTLQPLKH